MIGVGSFQSCFVLHWVPQSRADPHDQFLQVKLWWGGEGLADWQVLLLKCYVESEDGSVDTAVR